MRPLEGRRVVVTRSRAQASGIRTQLEELGATVLEVPVLTYAATAAEIPNRARLAASLLAFTSVNGVQFAAETIPDGLGGLRAAVVGAATAAAARDRGVDVVLVAAQADAEGLLQALLAAEAEPIVWFRGADARPVLAAGLRAAGREVVDVVIYAAQDDPAADEALCSAAAMSPQILTFASSNTASAFDRALERIDRTDLRRLPAISIGSHTSARLRLLGYADVREASEATIDALVAAVLDCAATMPASPG